jgi:hypothetical protein
MPGHRIRPYLDESARLSIHELVRDGLLDGKHGTNLYLKVTTPNGCGTQTIALTPLPTMVPGRAIGQRWYFICGETGRRASVLYRPAGEQRFASQRHWIKERKALYRTQGCGLYNRVFQASEKIVSRLEIDDDYSIYKPKWMRWKTYHRLVQRPEKYERWLDSKLLRRVGRIARAR